MNYFPCPGSKFILKFIVCTLKNVVVLKILIRKLNPNKFEALILLCALMTEMW